MPQDCHGKPLAIGDTVLLRGTVIASSGGVVTVETDIPIAGQCKCVVDIGAHQVRKLEAGIREVTHDMKLTGDETSFIEFHAGRNLARDGKPLPDRASDAARAGHHMQAAILQAGGA